jgi:hypothetical protein
MGNRSTKLHLHAVHNSLFAFACRAAEEGFTESETEIFIRDGIQRYGNEF